MLGVVGQVCSIQKEVLKVAVGDTLVGNQKIKVINVEFIIGPGCFRATKEK
jgi:hypothetical protein